MRVDYFVEEKSNDDEHVSSLILHHDLGDDGCRVVEPTEQRIELYKCLH